MKKLSEIEIEDCRKLAKVCKLEDHLAIDRTDHTVNIKDKDGRTLKVFTDGERFDIILKDKLGVLIYGYSTRCADLLRSLGYQIENQYEKEVDEKELRAIWTVATKVGLRC